MSSRAVSGSTDRILRVWDLEAAVCIEMLAGHTDAVRCLACDWSSQCLFSGSADKTLKLWDIASAICLQTVRGHDEAVRCVALDTVASATQRQRSHPVSKSV